MTKSRIAPPGGRDEQIRRTARILDIVQQISVAPGQWGRKRLAEHHELSERMIQKDLEIIRYRLGLDLEHDGRGYYFVRIPQLPTTSYSFGEAIALLTAARASQAVPGVNSADLAAAIARLESLFPQELQPMLREATERLPQQAIKSHRQSMLTLLHRALVERHQLRVQYATSSRQGRISERTLEPYAILPYGRSWHLVAFDHRREEVLQFKVDRLQKAKLTEETYVIPRDFDLEEYLGDDWGILRGTATTAESVVLVFSPESGRWVTEELWHKSQVNEELADGRMQVTFHVGVTPEMIRWLMYYGKDVWIVEPLWVRERVQRAHRQAIEREEHSYA